MKISHLFENSTTDEYPFLKKFHIPLYHGSSDLGAGIHDFRHRVKPRDTFRPVHNTIAKKSIEKFGIDVRSLLFASLDEAEAEEYGIAYEFVPLGTDYRVFVSKYTTDMTVELKVQRHGVTRDLLYLMTKSSPDTEWDFKDLAKIEKTLPTDIQQNFEGGVKEFFEYFVGHVLDILDTYDKPYSRNKVIETFRKYEDDMMKKIDKYLNEIVEITSFDQLSTQRTEVMVYAPSGFELLEVE